MSKKSLEKLEDALNEVFFGKYSNLAQKTRLLISLCNYFKVNEFETNLQQELKKLNDNLLDYELLERLCESLERMSYRDFHWSPNLNNNPNIQNIHLSPTFNLPVIEKSSIINEIEIIRERLNSNQPNINLIISSLATLSKKAGFLNLVKQDNA